MAPKGHPQYNTGRTWFKKGQTSPNKGKKFSAEYRKKLSDAHIGQTAWNKGLKNHLSEEAIQKMSIAKRGERSPRWNGGVTGLAKCIRNLLEARRWRIRIYIRDNYTCQKCGLRNHQNHAHHINAFADLMNDFLKKHDHLSPIEDKDELIELAKTYIPFWDMGNGITLCPKCHADVD